MVVRRRTQGTSLTGLAVIGGVLYFTHAGAWLGDKFGQVESGCYSALGRVANGRGTAVCTGLDKAVSAGKTAAGTVSNMASQLVERVRSSIEGSVDLNSAVGSMHVPSSLLHLGSDEDGLLQKMQVGPQVLNGGTLSNAIDGFKLGQRYMGADGSDAADALPWFRQAASIKGYGLLSQLSLGDIYRNGTPDVQPNPSAAIQYYAQSYQSISLLEQSNSPQAQQLLAALPASPEVVKQQLLDLIHQLKISK